MGEKKGQLPPLWDKDIPQTMDVPPNLPVNQLGTRAGSRMQTKWAPGASGGYQGGESALPAASLQSPAQISGCSESLGDPFHPPKTDLGSNPDQQPPPVPTPAPSHRAQGTALTCPGM